MIELRISQAAAFSIIEQSDYYLLGSDIALAERWEQSLDRAMRSITHSPERGAPCRFRSSALIGLRWIFVPGFPKHMIFYRYLPKEAAIQIVHVL